MIKSSIFLASLLIVSALADEAKINDDGTLYEAPRLAGDSLAVKPLEKEVNDHTADNVMDMFKNGTVKGLIRYSGQHRTYRHYTTQDGHIGQGQSPSKGNPYYSAVGGYLGYKTAPLYNISLGGTFYTAQPVGTKSDYGNLGGLADDGGQYTVLSEAYIKYKIEDHDARYGRREMPNYRFISLSNIRFSPITHQGATYENDSLEDIKFTVGYIEKMKERNSDVFIDMARGARLNLLSTVNADISNYDSSGNYIGANKAMPMLGIQVNKDDYTLEGWDYYVDDFINTVYLYADYTFHIDKTTNLTFAAQYVKQNNVADSIAGDINSWLYGVKMQASWKSGVTTFLNYNQVAYNENSYAGGTLFVRWGTPQMFNSFQVQDSELAGTKSIGAGLQLELGRMGLVPNSVIRFRYGIYDMPDSIADKYAAQDRSEATFDWRYSFTKNDGFGIFTEMEGLSVQFRIAYDDFKTDYDFEAYKTANGYSFESVTEDFIDTRLYVDYLF